MLFNSVALALALATLFWGWRAWKFLPLILLIVVCVMSWTLLRIVSWCFLRYWQTGVFIGTAPAQVKQVGIATVLRISFDAFVFALEYVAISIMLFQWAAVFLDAIQLERPQPFLKWSLVVFNISAVVGSVVTIAVVTRPFAVSSSLQDFLDMSLSLLVLSRVLCGGALMLVTLLCLCCGGGIVFLLRAKARHHVMAVVKALVLFLLVLLGLTLNALLLFGRDVPFLAGVVVTVGMTVSQVLVVVPFLVLSIGAVYAHRKRINVDSSKTTGDEVSLEQPLMNVPARYEI